MHFLQNLITYMFPIDILILNTAMSAPAGFGFVVDYTGAFVVTSNGDFVIAKT